MEIPHGTCQQHVTAYCLKAWQHHAPFCLGLQPFCGLTDSPPDISPRSVVTEAFTFLVTFLSPSYLSSSFISLGSKFWSNENRGDILKENDFLLLSTMLTFVYQDRDSLGARHYLSSEGDHNPLTAFGDISHYRPHNASAMQVLNPFECCVYQGDRVVERQMGLHLLSSATQIKLQPNWKLKEKSSSYRCD